MIAAELAVALGSDLGLASDNDLADELARTAPAYAGLTQEVLHSDVAHDGILVPLTGNEDHRDDVEPDRPRGAARRRVGGAPGRAAPRRHRRQQSRLARTPPSWAARRPCSPGPVPAAPSRCRSPRPTATACGWSSGRRLYDAGSSVTGSPSLTPLVPDAGGPGQSLRPRPPRRARPATA